jgi:hypothetical protein
VVLDFEVIDSKLHNLRSCEGPKLQVFWFLCEPLEQRDYTLEIYVRYTFAVDTKQVISWNCPSLRSLSRRLTFLVQGSDD